jgi:hypothetical protein
MKRVNVQLSSPKTERKAALIASVFVMVAAWLFFAAGFVYLFIASLRSGSKSSGLMVAILSVLGLGIVLIPVQLARYFRSCRGNK